MNARNANVVETISETQGKPLRFVRRKMAGAFPAAARPSAETCQVIQRLDKDQHEQRARELVYISLDAADHADVNRQPLMI
jgi:hypothetical protein